jgi:UDP-glucose:(heptosyl)LPS alpha-1,3-glucosyltransferase
MERSRLKIAMVRPYLTAGKGGAERYARDLVRGLAEAGHDVHVFAHVWDKPEQPGVIYNKVAMPRKPAWLRVLLFQRNLRRCLRLSDYNIVFGLTPFLPQQVFWLGDGLYRVWVRIAWPLAPVRWLMCLKRAVMAVNLSLERRILGPVTAGFIANSKLVARQARRFYGVPAEQIAVVYPWIDTQRFNFAARERWRDEMRRDLRIQKGEIVLLFVSNNFARKGLAIALRALASMRPGDAPMRLIVAGAGSISGFRRRAKRLGVAGKTVFTGAVTDIERYYAAADIFILPTRYDPCATVCLEAMACGLPVVTTAMNGAAEFIDDSKTGFVLGAGDSAESLAARIRDLADHDRCARAGGAAAERVRHLTPAAHLGEIAAALALFAKGGATSRMVQFAPDLWINESFVPLLRQHGLTSFSALMETAQRSEIEYNRNKRIALMALTDGDGERQFFLKAHRQGRSWIGALGRQGQTEGIKEWRNIMAIQSAGIATATPVAAGERQLPDGSRQSFVMTLRLDGYLPLDAHIAARFAPPLSPALLREKRLLIRAVAAMARRMHGRGFNHQDFYLCHIFAKTGNSDAPELRIIDLQRVGYRRRPARRWVIKDLGELHYSSNGLPISDRDRLRFMASYSTPKQSRRLRRFTISQILRKSRAIARHDAKLRARNPVPQNGFENNADLAKISPRHD